MDKLSTIATISLETGISKEVLRKWEERYGFPTPERDQEGHRLYPAAQIERLKLIKQLLDRGMRPAQVVPLDEALLHALIEQEEASRSLDAPSHVAMEVVEILASKNSELLRTKVQTEVHRTAFENFICDVMPSLNKLVGEAWAQGRISISGEHLYTEIMQGLIREEISGIAKPEGTPRVLLSTPSGELHTLGLLMVESLVSLRGGCCISLGAQTPAEEIGRAVMDYQADIAALSFSVSFPKRKITPLLKEIRQLLPRDIGLWAGGSGILGLDRKPHGVTFLPTLHDVSEALKKFKKRA